MKKATANPMDKQGANLLAAFQNLNKLAIGNLEKLSTLQMTNLQAYTQMGVDQLKGLAEIDSPEGLQAYVTKQAEVLKSVNEKLVADTQAMVKQNAEFTAEAQKLAQESVAAVTKTASA